MKEKLDLQYIQYDRHNLMNDLQLIYGFLQMDRPKDAMDHVKKLIIKLRKERKLLKAEVPQFAYFLLMFNYYNESIRLSYSIKTSRNLRDLDQVLKNDSEQFLTIVKRNVPTSELHHITVHLEEISPSEIQITFILEDLKLMSTNFKEECQRYLHVNNFRLRESDEIYCSWTYIT